MVPAMGVPSNQVSSDRCLTRCPRALTSSVRPSGGGSMLMGEVSRLPWVTSKVCTSQLGGEVSS